MEEYEKVLSRFDEVIAGDIPVLVDFYATWCGPCKMMSPVLEELKHKLGDKLRIIKLDIENKNNIKVVQRFRVRSVPTLMIFRRGELVWHESGARDLAEMERIVSAYL